MPIVKLSPDTPLDAPAGTAVGSPSGVTVGSSPGATKLPSDTKLDAPTDKQPSTAFFGLTDYPWMPSFLKGPSVGDQFANEAKNIKEAEAKAGRKLTLSERAMMNPIVMGFGTHQYGEAATAMTKGPSESFIRGEYTRSVKPNIYDKGYEAQSRDAINSIVNNKANLSFTDADGNVKQGELPASLEEFADAVDQTKQDLFSRYNAMANQTQAAGMDVTLMPAVAELQKIAADPVTALQHPELAKHVNDMADRYQMAGQLPAADAQRLVTSLNQGLKAFYRNPTYEIAGRANVDAMVVNRLRDSLDRAVEAAVGPGYQELKTQYGSLKAIERDVNKRAQTVARQEKGGGILGRITDAFSAEEVIRGLVTLNPAAVARGGGMKLFGESMKYLRSPNRAVTRLFQEAEKESEPISPSIPMSPIAPQRNPMLDQDQGSSALGLR